MDKFKGMMTSLSPHWATPKGLYKELDKEFHFNDDPCPLQSNTNGLDRKWGTSVFLNPPYGREISKWLSRAVLNSRWHNSTVVCLIPSRTDTKWWHDFVMQAKEIRFIKGRLRFGNAKNSAPFPSCIVIFRGRNV